MRPSPMRALPIRLLELRSKIPTIDRWFEADLVIDRKGRVSDLQSKKRDKPERQAIEEILDYIEKATGHRDLFSPATIDGKPVNCKARLFWEHPSISAEQQENKDPPTDLSELEFALSTPPERAFDGVATVFRDIRENLQGVYLQTSLPKGLQTEILQGIASWDLYPFSKSRACNLDFHVDPATSSVTVMGIRESSLIPPQPNDNPLPRLPQGRIEGRFCLEFIVTKGGTVRDLKILETPHKVYNPFIIETIEQWTFIPASRDGKTVEMMVTWELSIVPNGQPPRVPMSPMPFDL